MGVARMRGLSGKVALITGAARGQGRSHAVRLAEEGVDVIAVDICASMPTVPYGLGTAEDLAETVALVEKTGRRIVGRQGDVRDLDGLEAIVRDGVGTLGRLDIIVANAGIAPVGGRADAASAEVWRDIIDVNLTGAWNAARAGIPHILEGGRGGSIVFTSSTAGLKGLGRWSTGGGPAYSASKHGLVGVMRSLANDLAPDSIRVNTLHPTGVATDMVLNDQMRQFLSEHEGTSDPLLNALPVEMLEPGDVSDALLWLVSDEARYVTGVTLPVDAGYLIR
jgi:SDR family mycofactocin-dependent oxidoreductase